MAQATSSYLNHKLRTQTEALQDMLARRFSHYRNFVVRGVSFSEGYGNAGSAPMSVFHQEYGKLPEAYGVYGDDVRECPDEPPQYHVHDCGTLKEAEALASHLNWGFPNV